MVLHLLLTQCMLRVLSGKEPARYACCGTECACEGMGVDLGTASLAVTCSRVVMTLLEQLIHFPAREHNFDIL